MASLDEPIAISTLKRFAAEHGTLPAVAAPANRRAEKVAIVGGGPAGMSAAYYLARLGYGGHRPRGDARPRRHDGDRHPRVPAADARSSRRRSSGSWASAWSSGWTPRWVVTSRLPDLEREGFKAIFLATGASKSRRLGVPGDDLRGRHPGDPVPQGGQPRRAPAPVGRRDRRGRRQHRDGRGPVGEAQRRGVGHHRLPPRSRGHAGAGGGDRGRRARGRSRSLIGLAPTEVVGRDGTVVAIRVDEMRPSGDRRRRPHRRGRPTGATRELPAAAILVAIGEEPDPSILPEGAGIEVSGWAGIVADPRTLATGRAGIFAGGDVVSGPKTIIEAVAAGRRAAAIHPRVPRRREGWRGRDPRRRAIPHAGGAKAQPGHSVARLVSTPRSPS